jgi:hypothetical protein
MLLLSADDKPARAWIARSIVVGMIGVSIVGLANYYFNPEYAKAPNWPALTETLQTHTRPEDAILRNVPDPAFDYYYDGPTEHVVTLPSKPEDSQSQTEGRVNALLTETARVWFIPIEHQFWDPENVVATHLEANSQLVVDTWADNLRLQRWSTWDASPGEIVHKTTWRIEEVAHLAGYDTSPTTDGPQLALHPSETLTLIVYWEPLANSQQPLTAFTHLLGPATVDGSTFWAGHDHPPQDGRLSTTTWADEAILRDTFVIEVPPHAPQGDYVLALGIYDTATGHRLPIYDEHGDQQGDSISLLDIQIAP